MQYVNSERLQYWSRQMYSEYTDTLSSYHNCPKI